MNQPTYYTILPAEVRYNRNLNPSARLLYGDICLLAAKDGFCSATNEYFATVYDVDDKTISGWISELVKAGYVRSSILKNFTRKLYPRVAHLPSKRGKKATGVSGNADGGVSPKDDNNSTSINTTSKIDDTDVSSVHVFDSKEYFKRMIHSSDRALSIIGYYVTKRELYANVSSKEQASAIIARNMKVARRLAVFEKEKVAEAIARCESTVIRGQPMTWYLETVEKFLLG